jgi:hypothetical protein
MFLQVFGVCRPASKDLVVSADEIESKKQKRRELKKPREDWRRGDCRDLR